MASAGILVQLRVTGAEAQMLKFIAERGSEIPWDWAKCSEAVTRMIRGMIDEKRLLVFLQAEQRLRMTDAGRAALSQIHEAERRAPRIIGA